MGCDIHFVIERQVTRYDYEEADIVPVPGRWVGVYATWLSPVPLNIRDPLPKMGEKGRGALGFYDRLPAMKSRNYSFFARLARVRGDGPEPKGAPDDASELARMMIDEDGADGHSHSWDTLKDFIFKWLVSAGDESAATAVASALEGNEDLLASVAGVWPEAMKLYRVVYWFDN